MTFSRARHCLLKLPAVHRFVRAKFYSAPAKQKFPVLGYGNPVLCSTSADIYDTNAKISRLGRHGEVQDARLLFDQMPRRDAVSYAAMITVYLKNNDLPRAERLFRTMPNRSIVAESAMVHAYAKAGRIDDALKVFNDMPEKNVFSWTGLISGYLRSGLVDEAGRLFQKMPVKNVISWTTVLLGYAQNGLIDQARSIFDQMPVKNTVTWTAMMKAYFDNGRIYEARRLFHEMPDRNLYSWNIMLSGCLENSRIDEAIELFSSMPRRNTVSWTTMMTGLAQKGLTEQAREYFDRMPRRDVAAWNAMITAYADEALMFEASELFNSMPERDTISWNAMIDGYARNGQEGEAFELLVLMLRSDVRPNETTITSVLTSCRGTLELLQTQALVILHGFERDRPLTNALISMYSRSGDISSARLAFETLDAKDVVSWTAMILAYSYHGCGYLALLAFARMLRSGEKPDDIIFVGVLSACSHAGLVEKGRRLFDSMNCLFGLEPKAEHYSCLVDLLGRAGLVDEAVQVVSKMPPQEVDSAVLGALLGACRLHEKVELANHIGEKLIELEPGSSGGYRLLANVYAAQGKWDEFAQVWRKMRQQKVKKEPGFSEIEIKGKTHAFFVEDRFHPQKDEIYRLLQEGLLPLMQEMEISHDNSLDLCDGQAFL